MPNSERLIDKFERKEFVQFMWTILDVEGGKEKEKKLAKKLLEKFKDRYSYQFKHNNDWDNAFDLWKMKLRFDFDFLYQKKRSKRQFSYENKIGKEHKYIKDPKKENLYTSEDWYRLSRIVKKIYGNTCMRCGSFKQPQADHIKPRSLFPELELDISNIQVLCKSCNFSKSNKETKDYRTKEDLVKLANYLLSISSRSKTRSNLKPYYPTKKKR